MPFVIGSRRLGRLAAIACGLTLAAAAPGTASAATASNPLACTPGGELSHVFAGFGDTALYTPAPGGSIESALTGWTLTGGATRVAGNEPYYVGSRSDRYSLTMPGGSTAVTAPLCIDKTYPLFRLFARNTGVVKSGLKVDVLFLDAKGNVQSSKSGTYTAASTAWAPTTSLKIGITFGTGASSAAPVAFRFTAAKDAKWQIDDVYVDPWARR